MRARTLLCCSGRFLSHPTSLARQHRPAAIVAGGAQRESLAAGSLCYCRQYLGRIYYLAYWPQRWRSGVAALCACTPAWASCGLGGASPNSRGLSSCPASSAHSATAVCARLWRAGRLAWALPCRLRLGSLPALLLHCLARRDLRTQGRPAIFRKPPEMVDSAALRVRRVTGERRLLRNMEGPRLAQGGRRRGTRIACRGRSAD